MNNITNENKRSLMVMDKSFPNNAPHHIVIMSDKEYKEREEKIKQNIIFNFDKESKKW